MLLSSFAAFLVMFPATIIAYLLPQKPAESEPFPLYSSMGSQSYLGAFALVAADVTILSKPFSLYILPMPNRDIGEFAESFDFNQKSSSLDDTVILNEVDLDGPIFVLTGFLVIAGAASVKAP